MGAVFVETSLAGCAPALLEWVDACGRLPGETFIRDGSRLRARQKEIFSWGRTIINPHEPPPKYQGPNGLGSIATNASDTDSTAHGWKADGCFHALDFECKPGTAADYEARGRLAEQMGLTWLGRVNVGGKPDIRHVETKVWRQLGPGPEPSGSGVGSGVLLLVLAGAAALALKG